MKILFVCTGNTCRSPMAEGIFRRALAERGLSGRVLCQSAGLAATEGEPVSPNAALACQEIGVDISGHRARRLRPEELLLWDLFFPMTETQAYILRQAGAPEGNLYVSGNIADPFGGDLPVYRQCRDALEKELDRFFRKIVEPRLG